MNIFVIYAPITVNTDKGKVVKNVSFAVTRGLTKCLLHKKTLERKFSVNCLHYGSLGSWQFIS